MKNKKILKWILIIIIAIAFIGFSIESSGWHTIGNIRILDTLNGSLYTRSLRGDTLNVYKQANLNNIKLAENDINENDLQADAGIFFTHNRKLIFAYNDGQNLNYFYFDPTNQANQQWIYSATKP